MAFAWVLIGVLAVHLVMALRFWWVTDDAYISFRFARNLALGHGPRFNVWEAAPVEGYSNFLWVAIGAAIHAVGADMEAWTPVLSYVSGAALLAVFLHRLVAFFQIALPIAAIVSLGLALYPPFAVWSTSGLATMPFAWLLFLTFDRFLLVPVLADRPVPWISGGLSAAGLSLLRTEGLAWVGVVLLLAIFARLVERRRGYRGLFLAFGMAVVVSGAHLLWRHAYYGEWLPNTYYAKSVHGPTFIQRGYHYVAAHWLTFLTPFVLLPGAFFALRAKRRGIGASAWLLAVAFPAYAIVVSGDYMPMGRFLVPGFAFTFLVLAWILDDLAGGRSGRTIVASGVGVLVVVAGALPGWDAHVLPEEARSWSNYRFGNPQKYDSEHRRWVALGSKVELWRKRGRELNAFARQELQEPVSIVAQTLGAIGYETDFLIYDCAGLVVPEIARREVTEWHGQPGHDKAVEGDYFLEENPTILRFAAVKQEGSIEFNVRQRLTRWDRPSIRQNYRPKLVRLSSRDEASLLLVLLHADSTEDGSSSVREAWQASRICDPDAIIEVSL